MFGEVNEDAIHSLLDSKDSTVYIHEEVNCWCSQKIPFCFIK
jgi:hypothetical protein